jgi:hypothetical protein
VSVSLHFPFADSSEPAGTLSLLLQSITPSRPRRYLLISVAISNGNRAIARPKPVAEFRDSAGLRVIRTGSLADSLRKADGTVVKGYSRNC